MKVARGTLSRTRHFWPAAAILLIALVLRGFAFTPYGVIHPDEAFQYIEQAHRVAFGSSILPWEYRLGMRSWLVPLLLAGPMWLGDWLAPGTILYIALPRLFAALLALAPIGAAYAIGARISRTHAIVAMAVVGWWVESVYFSVHVLTEVLAVAAFMPAAALLRRGAGPQRLIAAGVLLSLSVIFRFHYAPAVALFAAITLRADWRAWAWLCVGGASAALISGAVDVAMGQLPFAWVIENFRQNVLHDRASDFGTSPALAYFELLWRAWGPAGLVILALATWVGGRRFPGLLAAAIGNFAVHSLIAHKEYRFIWLSVSIVLLLAAIGSVDLAWRWWRSRGARPDAPLTTGALIAIWAMLSALLAVLPSSAPAWRNYVGGFQMARRADAERVCGVALLTDNFWASGGRAYLHRPIPLYFLGDLGFSAARPLLPHLTPAFDAVIAPPNPVGVPSAYRLKACGGTGEAELCLFVRPGGCQRSPQADHWLMQAEMVRGGR